MTFSVDNLKFDAHGLIPAIIQDYSNGQVLMMAYMNKESFEKTLETGKTWFYSRSRQKLWNKGETSGHFQLVKDLFYDCDADTLLVLVEQTGVACHEGVKSCFHYKIEQEAVVDIENKHQISAGSNVLNEVYDVIMSRKAEMPEGSYTTYLFTKGLDKILKKVGEETAEVIIGAKNRDKAEVVYEVSDLLYHLTVLLAEQGVTPEEVFKELSGRR
jgi:phosphoribosyl-AMP cyclohydrolase / phosphoribosyl-ATP pyrophosphohydrolase